MGKKIRTEEVDHLFEAILCLKNKEECYTFFEDVCTINELLSLSQRFEVAKMLTDKRTYLDISEKTGASTATISRVNRSLNYGNDGYEMVFSRMKEKEAAENGISAYELMNREIEKSPVGANGLLYLPYILGERSPRWNTNARGAFVGLKMEHTRGDMLRATIEGILMNLCIILDVFRKDMDITELNVIGGLAKGDVVRRALADIYGVRAKRLNWLDEATSMGAAVCAGVGAGVLEDFGAIHRFIKVDDVLEPDMEHHKRYNELKQYFDECYTGLLKTYDNLAQWK